ncbi:MAG TPA: hypothetical protein VFY74_02710 [Methyloceanibacter sp.]|jgi:hypothetical protein|nr:hypothetical protein [Methyloceanibacter sp.]
MSVEFGKRESLGTRIGKTAPDLSRLFLGELDRAFVMLLHHPDDLGQVGLTFRRPGQNAIE